MAIIDLFAEKLHTLQERERSERIVLLWLYVNPHGTFTRTTNSLLKQVKRVLIDNSSPETKAKYKNQILKILMAILHRLEQDAYVDLFYREDTLIKTRLTGKGRQSIEEGLSANELTQLRQLGRSLQ